MSASTTRARGSAAEPRAASARAGAESPTPLGWHTLPRWLLDTRRVDDAQRAPRAAPADGPAPLSRWWRANLVAPVFVLGAPRSGTSFLGAALGALPELSYHYEPPLAKALGRCLVEGSFAEARARRWLRATYAWLMCRRGEGHLRFAEKTPQNCFVIPFLERSFEGARFVHIVRDGRDAALSYREQPWLAAASAGSGRRESGGYPVGPGPRYWVEPERRDEFRGTSDWHRCIWSWRRFVEAALAGLAALPAERVHSLRYEALVRDPRAEGERLLDFLAIDAAASRSRLREALDGAEPPAGGWRQQLGPEEAEVGLREAGALLERLGYAEPGRAA